MNPYDIIVSTVEIAENIGAMVTVVLLFFHSFPLALSRRVQGINFLGIAFFSLISLIALIPVMEREVGAANLGMVAILLAAAHGGLVETAAVGLVTLGAYLIIGSGWLSWAVGMLIFGMIAAFLLNLVRNSLTNIRLGLVTGLSCLGAITYAWIFPVGINDETAFGAACDLVVWFRFIIPVIIGTITGTMLLNWLIGYLQEHDSFTQLLSEAEIKYRSLVESSIVGIYVIQGNRIIYANRGFAEISGISQSELLAIDNIYKYIHPDDQAKVRDNMKKRLAGEHESISYEIRLVQDNRVVYVEVHGSIFENNGEQAIVGTLIDITQRRQAEQALRESEERFRYLTNHIPIMIWMEDKSGRCIFVNKEWQEYTGCPWDEGNEMVWNSCVHPKDRKFIPAISKKAVNQRGKFSYQFRMLRFDGEYRWVEGVGIPRYQQDGSFAGYIGCCFDIHDKKMADKVLKQSYKRMQKSIEDQTHSLAEANATLSKEVFVRRAVEKRYRKLFDSVQDSIFVWKINSQGNPDRIFEVNDIACRQLGYTRDELLARSLVDIMCIRSGVDWFNLEKLQLSRQAIFELEFITKEGTHIPFEVNTHSFSLNGEIVGLCIARDISDRKKAEAELLEARNRISHTEKLAFLGTMAAGIAHEINQPLNSIKVTADSILMWSKEGTAYNWEEFIEDVQNITDQSTRIANIIKYIRDIIRVNQQTNPQRFSITSAINNAIKMIHSQHIASGIALTIKMAEDPLEIYGSIDHMEHVILNLVNNAKEALASSEESAKEIVIETRLEDKIIIEISDNGPGIAEENKQKIFEQFFTTKSNGMGMGLAIVKSVVTSHGGEIYIINNWPGETTFRLEFPIIEADSAQNFC